MGKTRDLVKRTGAIKGTFHAKMGTIKDKKGMDITEEDIKNILIHKNTQKNYIQKIFMTQIIMMV